MNKEFKIYLQSLLIILDILLLNLSFIIAFFLNKSTLTYISIYNYFVIWIFLNFFWLLVSIINGIYFEKSIIHFETYTKKSIQVYFIWIAGAVLLSLLINRITISNNVILLTFVLWGILLMINRFIYLGIRNYYKDNEHLFKKVLILGYNETALKLASYLDQDFINMNLKGFVEDRQNINELTPYPVLADRKDVIKIANQLNVEEIFSTLDPSQNNFLSQLINEANNNCIRIKIVPDLSYFFSKPVVVNYLRDLPILSPRSEPLEDIGNQVKKRFLDLVVSFMVIIFILSWMIPLIALLIIIESRGPVFFIQQRTGKNNRPFKCLKFRSMFLNNNADKVQAIKNDSRITKVGKVLRKTSLDEFPQFINVFKGEMSLVGPRPHMLKHTDEYSKIVNQFMIRHFSKPGITGWAQINGFRGEITDPRQIKLRVENDIWYLEKWNIWLDIKIIFLTVYKVFKGDKNAY